MTGRARSAAGRTDFGACSSPMSRMRSPGRSTSAPRRLVNFAGSSFPPGGRTGAAARAGALLVPRRFGDRVGRDLRAALVPVRVRAVIDLAFACGGRERREQVDRVHAPLPQV